MAQKIQHANLSEKTYERIKDAILKGNLSPGRRLLFDQLARGLGVSRTPLREAVVRLEKEGFVVSVPRGGTYVKKFSKKDIKEIYEIREMLEALAAMLAATIITDKQLQVMRDTCRKFKNSIEKRNVQSCVKMDLKFHDLLIEASRNDKLSQIIRVFNLQVLSISIKGPEYWSWAEQYVEGHLAIIEALSKQDSDLTETLIREHIKKGKELILSSGDY